LIYLINRIVSEEIRNMKDDEIGVVIELDGKIAKVRASRHSDCKNCGACPGDNAIVLNTRNPLSAKVGQLVTFEIQETNMPIMCEIIYPFLYPIYGNNSIIE